MIFPAGRQSRLLPYILPLRCEIGEHRGRQEPRQNSGTSMPRRRCLRPAGRKPTDGACLGPVRGKRT